MAGARWPWRRDNRRLRGFTLTSTAFVAAICMVEIWPGDRWWLTAPLTWMPQLQWALLPALLVLWSVLAGNLRWAAMNLAATVFILLGPAGLQVRRMPTPRAEAMVAVSHNVAHRTQMVPKLSDHWSGNCDVLCVQEAAEDAFAKLLSEKGGYEQAAAGDVRTFVRGRIIRSYAVGPAEGSHREFLACDAEIGGTPVAILNVHLATNVRDPGLNRSVTSIPRYLRGAVEVRESQHRLIEDWVERQQYPCLVLGDFNTPPRSAYYRRLGNVATDSFGTVGRGFGYSYMVRGAIPALRIDYIWCANGVRPVRCATGGEWASDHKWIHAEIHVPSSALGG